MAARAQNRCVGELWNHRAWVLGVLREWSMAGLATHSGMFAFTLRIRDILVADLAGRAAGEFHRPCANIVQCAGPEVTIFAEIGGNHGMPDHQKSDNPYYEQQYHPEEVLGVP